MSVLSEDLAICKTCSNWFIQVGWGSPFNRWFANVEDWTFVFEMGAQDYTVIGTGHGDTPEEAIKNAIADAETYAERESPLIDAHCRGGQN